MYTELLTFRLGGVFAPYGVACQLLLAGFEEILAPAAIEIVGDAFTAT